MFILMVLINLTSFVGIQAVERISLEAVKLVFNGQSNFSEDIKEKAAREALNDYNKQWQKHNNIINNLKQEKFAEFQRDLEKQKFHFKIFKYLTWGFIFTVPVIIGGILGNNKFANDIEICTGSVRFQLELSGIEESDKNYTQKLNTSLFYNRMKYIAYGSFSGIGIFLAIYVRIFYGGQHGYYYY